MKFLSRHPTWALFPALKLIQPAYAQTQNCSQLGITSNSSCDSHNHQYNFTYPPNNYAEEIQASYTDTINVSWTSFEPSHIPTLTMFCDSAQNSSKQYGNSTTFCTSNANTSATNCYWLFSLALYKGYDTCDFVLTDHEVQAADSMQTILSTHVDIVNNTNSTGQIWSLTNPAPVVSFLSLLEAPDGGSGAGHVCVEDFGVWAIWVGLIGGALLVL